MVSSVVEINQCTDRSSPDYILDAMVRIPTEVTTQMLDRAVTVRSLGRVESGKDQDMFQDI